MVSMKYDISFLDCNNKFTIWQVKMQASLKQIDLEMALLGSNKMSSSWKTEKKQKKG